MRQRWLTALVAMPLVLAALASPSPWPLLALAALLTVGGLAELAKLCCANPWWVAGAGLSAFGAMASLSLGAAGPPGALHVAALASMLGAISILSVRARPAGRWLDARAAVAGLWIAGPMACLLAVHIAPRSGPWMGSAALLVVLPVWAGDTAAIFAGRAWGRRKLAPAISPNKTLEGAAAGLVASVLIGCVAGWALNLGGPSFGATAGALAGLFGQAGDLLESALKRAAGVKDSGGLFPGHGGVLDRLDSILLATPAVAVLVALSGL